MLARLDDVELDYEVQGDGPELVWLHGLSGSLEESRPLCEALAKSFRVLWYSSRGHGRSTAIHERSRFSYDRFADDLDAMIDVVGFTKPVVGGGSHGANTALRHAVNHAGRASGLVLVAPGANALRRPDRLRWALIRGHIRLAALRGEPHVVKAITGHDPRGVLDARAQQAVDAARTHELPALLSAMRLVPDQQVVAPVQVGAIDVPAVVAGWPGDGILHPIDVAKQIAELLPQGRFEPMQRPGELTPEEAADLIAGWVKGLAKNV